MKDVIENEVVEVEVDDVEVTTVEPEESEGGVFGTVLKAGAVIGGVVLVGHVIKKNWGKLKAYREEKAIAKLEKAGYVVSLPDFDEEVTVDEDVEDDVQ